MSQYKLRYSGEEIDKLLGMVKSASLDIRDWLQIQRIVRAGEASNYFNIGDQLQCERNGQILTWDIIGIDIDTPADPHFHHSITLQTHEVCEPVQRDAREALFVFPDGAAAGPYHFKVTQDILCPDNEEKIFQFTLAKAIPSDGHFVLTASHSQLLTGTEAKTFSGSTSTEVIETVTLSEGSGGKDLGDVSHSVGENTNSIQRALVASNRYSTSALRQYLNSSAAAGSVWSPQTPFDRPPDWASNTAGFLNGMDPDLVSVVGAVAKLTAFSTATDGGEIGIDFSEERFFLPSLSEVYGGNEVGDGEGPAYPYYANYSELPEAGTDADANRIKYRDGGAAVSIWPLRTPVAISGANIRVVNSNGSVGFGQSDSSIRRIAPCCCIV